MGVNKKMIYDYENKIIQVKIVYYGPAMSGKTTSLRYLFNYFGKQHKLDSIENSIGRTLFFDFGVLQFKGVKWELKFLLYTATGQDFYASTRPTILNGVDGIIFVADSQNKYMAHNLRSWNELNILFGNEIYTIPIVIALNKDDIEEEGKINEKSFIECIEYKRFRDISLNRTIALTGAGVLESFKRIICFIFPQLTININLTT